MDRGRRKQKQKLQAHGSAKQGLEHLKDLSLENILRIPNFQSKTRTTSRVS